MFLLCVGNIADGYTFYGPFDQSDQAERFAEHRFPNTEWTIVSLHDPDPLKTSEYNPEICVYCKHLWSNHSQNVHGIFVCRECPCRGMEPPLPPPPQ